ncbi:MAG: hypothetical protein P8Y48_13955 [Novosphingobium sp.]
MTGFGTAQESNIHPKAGNGLESWVKPEVQAIPIEETAITANPGADGVSVS